jgi:excisionase family DNA binding protein
MKKGRRPNSFTVREVADMISCSKDYILKQVNAGKLRGIKLPASEQGKQRKWRIFRDDLVRWLVAGGIPAERVRGMLNPDGRLFLVRTAADLHAAFKVPTFRIKSLFQLGLELRARATWGVVVDLPAVGTTEAMESMAEYSKRVDRPTLIGLYGEDGLGHSPAVSFDAVFDRGVYAETLARRILLLRPTAGPATRVDSGPA